MGPSAACAAHPDRPAVLACARCGGFVCDSCVVSAELCVDCRTRLLRDGVPWGPAEQGRQHARRWLRGADVGVRALSIVGSIGLGLVAFGHEGSLPKGAVPIGLALLAIAGALGLSAAGLAIAAYRASERGRPGPGVEGVVSRPALVFFVCAGAAPALLWLFAWVR